MAEKTFVYIDPKRWLRVTQIAIGILIASYFAISISLFVAIQTRYALETGTISRHEAVAIFRIAGGTIVTLSRALIILVFVVVIAFLCWLYRVAANVRAAGAQIRATPAFAVGMYFIPFYNLVAPPMAMSEIAKASVDPKNWSQQRLWKIIPIWWATQISSSMASLLAFVSTREPSAARISNILWVLIFVYAVNVVFHLSQLILVTSVTAAQRKYFQP